MNFATTATLASAVQVQPRSASSLDASLVAHHRTQTSFSSRAVRLTRILSSKREHLLNQIREQAKQIQELMAKVEALNRPGTTQSPHSPGSTLHSPMESNSESVVPNAEMQDWISRARTSIQEFGGLIPAGDPTETDDAYISEEAAEEYSDDEAGYATAEDDASRDIGSPASSIIKRQPAQTTQLKMLPGEDAPYGLMAVLSIRKNAREKSVEPESSEAVGVAKADFFRPSEYQLGGFVHMAL